MHLEYRRVGHHVRSGTACEKLEFGMSFHWDGVTESSNDEKVVVSVATADGLACVASMCFAAATKAAFVAAFCRLTLTLPPTVLLPGKVLHLARIRRQAEEPD